MAESLREIAELFAGWTDFLGIQAKVVGRRDDDLIAFGSDLKRATLDVVEQTREHAWRVESWTAKPIDRAGGRDQRGSLQIADQSMLGDQWSTLECSLVRPSVSPIEVVNLRLHTTSAGKPPASVKPLNLAGHRFESG